MVTVRRSAFLNPDDIAALPANIRCYCEDMLRDNIDMPLMDPV